MRISSYPIGIVRLLFLPVLLMAGIFSPVHAEEIPAGGIYQTYNCEARPLIGGEPCQSICRPPSVAACRAGLFQATCECKLDPALPNIWDLSVISEEQVEIGGALHAFLLTLKSKEAYILADAIAQVIRAVESGNNDYYARAEESFADLYARSSDELKEIIRAWKEEQGIE